MTRQVAGKLTLQAMKFLPRDGFQVCVELSEFAHAEYLRNGVALPAACLPASGCCEECRRAGDQCHCETQDDEHSKRPSSRCSLSRPADGATRNSPRALT